MERTPSYWKGKIKIADDFDQIPDDIIQSFYQNLNPNQTQEVSFLKQAEDLCGSIAGPKDLSTNKTHFDEFSE